MCGIMGYFSVGEYHPSLRDMLKSWSHMELRGDDGCGVAWKDGNSIIGFKTGLAISKALNDKDCVADFDRFVDANPSLAILHTRKATASYKSGLGPKNAHPFSHGNVVVIHNGIIKNAEELSKPTNFKFSVDSEVIPMLLDEAGLDTAEDDEAVFKSVLEKLHGDFAIAAITKNKNKLFLASNTKRPLVLIYDKEYEIYYFCSEERYLNNLFYFIKTEEVELHGHKFERSRYEFLGDPITLEIKECSYLTINDSGTIVSDKFINYEPPVTVRSTTTTASAPRICGNMNNSKSKISPLSLNPMTSLKQMIEGVDSFITFLEN